MAIDPQTIPFQPAQTPTPPPFSPGAYAGMAETALQRKPTDLQWAQFGQQGISDAMKSYLDSQRLQQQGPLLQAQAKGQQQQNYSNELVDPSSPSIAGTSSSAPQPSDPMMSMAPPQSQPSPSSFPGIGNQSAMSVQQSPAYSPSGQPNFGGGGQDPFGHMHMDPSQPFALHGSAQNMGMMMPQGGSASGNGAMIPRSKLFDYQETQANRKTYGSIFKKSPLVQKYLGDLSGMSDEDVGRLGDPAPILQSLGNIEQANMWKTMNFNAENQRFNTQQQDQPIQEAGKNYNDYVATDTAVQAAKSALAKAQDNPATFNTALFTVGKALGVQSRNPEMVIQAISAGDPSLAGQVSEYLSKKGAGKVTPELLNGLNSMMDDAGKTNQQSFEQKATAHAQQNASKFGGVNQALQRLYPSYQFSNQNKTPPPTGQGTSPGAPKIGDVRKGYKYVGGDPSQPSSWQKAPNGQ